MFKIHIAKQKDYDNSVHHNAVRVVNNHLKNLIEFIINGMFDKFYYLSIEKNRSSTLKFEPK